MVLQKSILGLKGWTAVDEETGDPVKKSEETMKTRKGKEEKRALDGLNGRHADRGWLSFLAPA